MKILSKTGCTISALRNLGAAQARGEILAFLDADCIVPKDWLKNAAVVLRDHQNGAAGCWYALPKETTLVERAWDLQMRDRRYCKGPVDWIPSGNLLIRRDVFDVCKGFNEALITAEDVDFCGRIRSRRWRVYSSPDLAVEHLGNPKSSKVFFQKEYWRGKGVAQAVLAGDLRPEFKKALAMAAVFLVLPAVTVLCALIAAAAGNAAIVLFPLSLMVLIPAALGLRVVACQRSYAYFLPVAFLFGLFGISRAFALLDREVWRNVLAPRIKET